MLVGHGGRRDGRAGLAGGERGAPPRRDRRVDQVDEEVGDDHARLVAGGVLHDPNHASCPDAESSVTGPGQLGTPEVASSQVNDTVGATRYQPDGDGDAGTTDAEMVGLWRPA